MKTLEVAIIMHRPVEDLESFHVSFTDGSEIEIPEPLYRHLERIMNSPNNRCADRRNADSITAQETSINNMKKFRFEVTPKSSQTQYIGTVYVK